MLVIQVIELLPGPENDALIAEETASAPHLDLSRAPYVLYGVKYIDPVSLSPFSGVPNLFLALGAPTKHMAIKLIISVLGLCLQANRATTKRPVNLKLLDLGRAPFCYGLYGVKYIDLVSPEQHGPSISTSYITPFFDKMACKQNLDLRCVLISDPSTLGAGAKSRLHTPKAVTYHEQYHTL